MSYTKNFLEQVSQILDRDGEITPMVTEIGELTIELATQLGLEIRFIHHKGLVTLIQAARDKYYLRRLIDNYQGISDPELFSNLKKDFPFYVSSLVPRRVSQ